MERIHDFWPEWESRTGIVMAETNECDRDLTLATIQTLSNEKRLNELLSHGVVDYLVVDEAHHAASKSYLHLIARLEEANPNLRILGVTATPIRTDGDGLIQVFEKVSFKYGIKELVALGHLVPFKALAISTGISLASVGTTRGDFMQGDLADAWECDNLYDLIVASHQKFVPDKPAMVFTVSVLGAHRAAARFNRAGISAAAADGTTPREERAAMIADFKSGKIKVLCNCALWTEGLDLPMIEVVHMARPTKSDLVYVQAIGRGLRLFPGKDEAFILDYAPADTRNIIMAGDLLGKPRKQVELEAKASREGVIIEGFSYTGEGTGIDGNPDELVTRSLNYLMLSRFAWYYHNRISTLSLGDGKTLAIVPFRAQDRYCLVELDREEGVRVLWEHNDFDLVADHGAIYAEQVGNLALIEKGKRWQHDEATDKQLDLLSRLMPHGEELERLNRGQASRLITSCLAERALASWMRKTEGFR
jgi:hypothetical protein